MRLYFKDIVGVLYRFKVEADNFYKAQAALHSHALNESFHRKSTILWVVK
jgi:hypothetical protein